MKLQASYVQVSGYILVQCGERNCQSSQPFHSDSTICLLVLWLTVCNCTAYTTESVIALQELAEGAIAQHTSAEGVTALYMLVEGAVLQYFTAQLQM